LNWDVRQASEASIGPLEQSYTSRSVCRTVGHL